MGYIKSKRAFYPYMPRLQRIDQRDILHQNIEHRQDKHQAVKAIHNAAMSRHDMSEIFDAALPFNDGSEQIAQNRQGRAKEGEQRDLPKAHISGVAQGQNLI